MAKKKRAVPAFEALRAEYAGFWANCEIRPEKRDGLERTARRIFDARPRYDVVAKQTGVPWFVIGIIHQMECNMGWGKHLHNGDSLKARTWQVPAKRPAKGEPPFTWEESACDALCMKGYDKWQEWSIERIAYAFENYNGWGYRWYHPEVHSAYLWSYTNLYKAGKYVADHVWSATAVSGQPGAMAILKTMIEIEPTAIDIHQPTVMVTAWAKADVPPPDVAVPGKVALALQSRTAWSAIGSVVSLVIAGVHEVAQYVADGASQAIQSLPSIVSDTKENVAAFTDLAQTVGIADHIAKVAVVAGVVFAVVALVRHVDLKHEKVSQEKELG